MPRHVGFPYNKGSEKVSHPTTSFPVHRPRSDDRCSDLDSDHERSALYLIQKETPWLKHKSVVPYGKGDDLFASIKQISRPS